jgi:hypothetical protein
MDAHEETLPVLLRKPTTDAQRAELLLRRQYNYPRTKNNPSPALRAVLEQIESRMSFVSGTTTCKTDQPPEVLALLDHISRQRTRSAASTRKPLFSSTTKCKKVLEWVDAHEGNLPVLWSNPITDAQRAELLLRRQFNYLKSKINTSPELRVVLEQIERRMSFGSGTTTCKKVLEWMYGHEMALPKEFRKPTTDAERAEYLLRNQFKYLKRKTDQPPEVLALLDQIKCLSLQVPYLKQFLTVPPWCLSSEDSESCVLPVPKRRRLLVKTKAPSLL